MFDSQCQVKSVQQFNSRKLHTLIYFGTTALIWSGTGLKALSSQMSRIKKFQMYEGHPIKNETFAIAQWIYMIDFWNLIQS